MKRSRAYQRGSLILLAALAGTPLFIGITAPDVALAQGAPTVSSQQLDSLTAPIALYPDALLAQVLMATTFPQDVLAAANWSKANPNLNGDDAVKAVASQPWDPSVQSLVAFPQVLATMASKPEWVTQLGNAFLAQPNDVMDSVQRLRKQAQQAGHLQTTAQQKVIVEQSTIQIEPANPQVVYVPVYNPTVVYGTWPYPAYPPVYVPPPVGYPIASGLAAGLAFGTGIAIANSLWGGFNWNTHDVNVNVNRYNNINVNHRLDVNSNTTNWNRNSNVNRNTNLNAAQRDAYRGRDASRAQAEQTLQNRTGQNLGGSASQRVQGIQKGGTNANAADLKGRAQNQSVANANDLKGRAQNQGGANANDLKGRAQNQGGANANEIKGRAQNVNRDNALRGAGDGNTARQDVQRGQASRQAQAGAGARYGAGGGGVQQHGGGLGAGGGQPRGAHAGAGGGGQRHFGR